LCIVTTLLLAACESKPDRHAMMEEARHAVPPMAANESFFAGTVIAHLTLGNNMGGGGSGGDADNGGGHAGAGGGGRHGRGGGGGFGGGGGGRGSGGSQAGAGADSGISPAMHSSNMPPAMMRLRLENTTASAIDVEVIGLDSELGDFAVRPDKLTLQPGQSAEPDPMESLLGVDTYSLPVTITLRTAGRTETKVLTLQLVKPAPDATPPVPPLPPAN
jgi:hypothetical protein